PVPRPAADGKITKVTAQSFPVAAAAADAGDTLLLEPGQYGAISFGRDSALGKPIVIRGTEGAICERVSLRGRKYVHLEGLTIKEKTQGYAGVDLISAVECVVRRCHIEAVYGVRATRPPRATNCYVADNVIVGTTPWTREAMGANGKNI